MGGEVGIESQEGVGSTFWFTVQLGTVIGARPQSPARYEFLNGVRALIVDDVATSRRVLAEQLSQYGIDAAGAANPAQAIAMLHEASQAGRAFDLALLDYRMPGCDGVELGRRIRADDTTRTMRLVLLSSSAQRSDAQRHSEGLFDHHLLKPVTRRDLTECPETALPSRHDAAKDHVPKVALSTRARSVACKECGSCSLKTISSIRKSPPMR